MNMRCEDAKDPRTGNLPRHHAHSDMLQRALENPAPKTTGADYSSVTQPSDAFFTVLM